MKKKSGPSGKNTILNDVLKLLYAAMLLEFPFEKIRQFWNAHETHVKGKKLKNIRLFDMLWSEGVEVSTEYFFAVLNDFETFLASEGINAEEFMQKLAFLCNGTIINPKTALGLFSPFVEALYTAVDIRAVLLSRIIPVTVKKQFRNFELKVLSNWRADSWNHMIVSLNWKDRPVPHYDALVYSMMVLKYAPRRFGLEPYEEVRMLSDARTPDEVVETAVVRGDDLFIEGRRYGTAVSFNKECKKTGIDTSRHRFTDQKVFLIEQEYFCPVRKRVVLHKNCMYGAPFYLGFFKFKSQEKRGKQLLSGFIDDVIENDFYVKAEQLHTKYLMQTSSIIFTYEKSNDRLFVDNRAVARSSPAKILQRLLFINTTTKRTEFEYREFLRDPSIVNDPANPNLAVRMQRLLDLIRKKVPEIEMTKTGRGTFIFRPKGEIVFREVEKFVQASE